MPRLSSYRAYSPLLLAAVVTALAGRAADVPLGLAFAPQARSQAAATLAVPLALPMPTDVYLFGPAASWVDGRLIDGRLVWPADAPERAQLLAFMKDRDGNWFQSLRRPFLTAGTNLWEFDFSAAAGDWQPVGHHGVWHHRTRLTPEYVGLRVFAGQQAYTGLCDLAQVRLAVSNAPPADVPTIRNVRPNGGSIPCFGLFELRFDLPDRHADPFDPAVVDVTARIVTPDGSTNVVNGFYMQDFFRLADSVGERLVPQGRPEWRLRYTPTRPGLHHCTLTATDGGGTAVWGPLTFEARPADGPRFVRVSRRAPRHFELDNGTPFFPIGHNTRSPFDTRMDEQFPWRWRHPEGTLAYRRYFQNMGAAGENLAEVWMCAWSLGLEWSTVIAGYHGFGDYHLGNGWELDEVLRWARENRLRVNLVLNNHGRVGTWYDGEWQDSPYNAARGGFIPSEQLMSFFDNPRAMELQRRLLRYIVARWGWDASIFAWELWSELDLAGAGGQAVRPHFDPRVIAWHREMGDYLRRIDPNRHLISTHLSGDYQATNPVLAMLPQLDHCAVDAYHGSDDPLHIVNLIRLTAEAYAPFNKPVLITEFGGSAMSAGLSHLRRELHAALWTSPCSLLAGTPLFWWWQVVEEQGLYEGYSGLARFMEDVDRRDPALAPIRLALAFEGGAQMPAERADHVALASPGQALAWIFVRQAFADAGATDNPPLENMTLTWSGCSNIVYRVEFWDTQAGQALRRQDLLAKDNRLTAKLPPLRRDVAVKIRPAPGAAGRVK